MNKCALSSAPYLASQPLDSSLLTQPFPSPSQSSSTQTFSSTSSQQGPGNAGGISASGPVNGSASSGSLMTSAAQPGSGMPSLKPTSFPPFGSMSAQAQGGAPQSGQLGQQASTQNTSSSGESSSSQAPGPTEPPERYMTTYKGSQYLVIQFMLCHFTTTSLSAKQEYTVLM